MIKGRATIGPIVNFIANKIKVYTIEKGIRKTEITAVNLNLFVTYIFTTTGYLDSIPFIMIGNRGGLFRREEYLCRI